MQDFQRNPNLRFPVPVISGIALPQSHLRKLFNPAQLPEGLQDRYTAVINRLRDEFIPLIENGTTAAVLRERAAAALAPLSEKFGVNFGNSSWNRLLDNPEAITQAQESIQYFKARAPETLSPEAGAREACTQNLATDYLGSLRNVVDYLMARNLDPLAIVDAEGRLRAFSDLAQLAIAPNCLNPANRTPLPAEISCAVVSLPTTTPRTPADIEASRTQVITSLRDGIPVGQAYQTGSASHINTIVGHRYNPARRECEFLIRESQTGTSEWMSDQMILNRAESLTIARRR